MKYKTNWIPTIFASIVLHVLAAIFFAFVMPKILPAQEVHTVTEIDWVDVDLVDEVAAFDEEFIPIEPAEIESSAFEFAPIELPPMPEFSPIEPFKPPEIEIIQPKPPEPEPVKEEPPKEPEPVEPVENKTWSEVPTLVSAVYPEESFGYTGEIMVMATIGKDGNVKTADLIFPTGNPDLDVAVIDAAKKWKFKPAFDKDGKPTECSYSINFNFKKIFGEE